MESIDYIVLSYCLGIIFIFLAWYAYGKLKELYGYEYRIVEQIYLDKDNEPIVEYIIEKRFLIVWTCVRGLTTFNRDTAIKWRDKCNNDENWGRTGIVRRRKTLKRNIIE